VLDVKQGERSTLGPASPGFIEADSQPGVFAPDFDMAWPHGRKDHVSGGPRCSITMPPPVHGREALPYTVPDRDGSDVDCLCLVDCVHAFTHSEIHAISRPCTKPETGRTDCPLASAEITARDLGRQPLKLQQPTIHTHRPILLHGLDTLCLSPVGHDVPLYALPYDQARLHAEC
jgi:hypothetical protein